jgi:hypothetical protein
MKFIERLKVNRKMVRSYIKCRNCKNIRRYKNAHVCKHTIFPINDLTHSCGDFKPRSYKNYSNYCETLYRGELEAFNGQVAEVGGDENCLHNIKELFLKNK